MEIILIEDVENLGRRGAVVKVAPGYARNYLIPKRFAMLATQGNMKAVANQKLVWAKQEARMKEDADLVANALKAVVIEIEKKAGEGDALYGSVTAHEIADLLVERGFQFDKRKIRLEHPIKTLGEYEVTVKLHHDVNGIVKVRVVAEGRRSKPAAEAPVVTE